MRQDIRVVLNHTRQYRTVPSRHRQRQSSRSPCAKSVRATMHNVRNVSGRSSSKSRRRAVSTASSNERAPEWSPSSRKVTEKSQIAKGVERAPMVLSEQPLHRINRCLVQCPRTREVAPFAENHGRSFVAVMGSGWPRPSSRVRASTTRSSSNDVTDGGERFCRDTIEVRRSGIVRAGRRGRSGP
jgi:hypothetical protein